MKKTKFIAIVLAIAVMLMGAGYAAWSEQLFVTTTVRTGNFDMKIVEARLRTGDNDAQNYAHTPPWSQFDWTHSGDVTIADNGNSAIVEFLDLYPGGCVQLDLKMQNLGTIPARLKSVNVEFISGNEELFSNLLASVSYKADVNGDGYKGWNDSVDKSAHIKNLAFDNMVTQLEEALIESLNSKNVVIEPNGFLALHGEDEEPNCIVFKLNPEAGNHLQNQRCRFKITFNWEQWSTNPSADNRNTYGGDGDIQPVVDLSK